MKVQFAESQKNKFVYIHNSQLSETRFGNSLENFWFSTLKFFLFPILNNAVKKPFYTMETKMQKLCCRITNKTLQRCI